MNERERKLRLFRKDGKSYLSEVRDVNKIVEQERKREMKV